MRITALCGMWLLVSACAFGAPQDEFIRVADDKWSFVSRDSGKRFIPCAAIPRASAGSPSSFRTDARWRRTRDEIS